MRLQVHEPCIQTRRGRCGVFGLGGFRAAAGLHGSCRWCWRGSLCAGLAILVCATTGIGADDGGSQLRATPHAGWWRLQQLGADGRGRRRRSPRGRGGLGGRPLLGDGRPSASDAVARCRVQDAAAADDGAAASAGARPNPDQRSAPHGASASGGSTSFGAGTSGGEGARRWFLHDTLNAAGGLCFQSEPTHAAAGTQRVRPQPRAADADAEPRATDAARTRRRRHQRRPRQRRRPRRSRPGRAQPEPEPELQPLAGAALRAGEAGGVSWKQDARGELAAGRRRSTVAFVGGGFCASAAPQPSHVWLGRRGGELGWFFRLAGLPGLG
mmetsp:Transcript_146260/g.467303  ORF Transcript_146260/g.467303 Transcript_146260/m.467303 type:complete len:327 (-) Transcript_146260:67-1047(-)